MHPPGKKVVYIIQNMDNTVAKLNSQYTIILGAEGELGRALAREVARKKCNLILVSTTSIDLQRFAIGLQPIFLIVVSMVRPMSLAFTPVFIIDIALPNAASAA